MTDAIARARARAREAFERHRAHAAHRTIDTAPPTEAPALVRDPADEPPQGGQQTEGKATP